MTESTHLLSSKRIPQSISERQRALKESGVGKAAHLIKDAVIGHQEAPYEGYYDPYENEQSVTRNNISVICGRLVVRLRGAVTFSSWVLFMLTFFEPPPWCRDSSNLLLDEGGHDGTYSHEYGDCKQLFDAYGTTEDGEENQELYPSSNSMWLTIYQSKLIELVCVCFISLFMAFAFADDGFVLRLFFYPGYKRWTHAIQCIVLVCLLTSAIFDNTTCNPFLRMLILGTFLRKFQLELWTFLKMIPEMMVPLSMLAIVVVFYAWFGVVIFYDSPQGIASFPNLAEGMWSLWICVTTANYPDVMMPSYNEHRGVALYFISFMVLSFFYLMNLVLAISVNAYDDSIESRKSSRDKLSKKLLLEAYSLLDVNGEDSVSRKSIMHVMTILNQDIPEIRGLTDDEKSIMYALLDKDGSNTISLDEFLVFSSVLLLKLAKKSDYATFVEIHLPSVSTSNSYQCLCKYVKSKRFENVMEIVLVLNALIVAAQDYPMLAGHDVSHDPHYGDGYIDTVWEGAETLFTVVYVMEAMLKIMVNGWKRYIESPRNAFDFFMTVLVVLASAYVYYPNAYNNRTLIEFVVMARVLRLSRLLFAIEKFRIFGAISLDIIPAAASVFLVLLFIAYSFASAGMLLYGGVISRDPNNVHYQSLMEADDFVDSNYWANNFNDMFSGMNVLFNMLVVNNWTTQSSGLELATGNKWLVRLYFLSFNLLGVIGISNVITSFVLNAFFQQLATINGRQGPEENVEGEAVISGSRAVFDSSVITGTETGLRESYFARIQPKHRDVELDEREALRQLFSGTSTASTESN